AAPAARRAQGVPAFVELLLVVAAVAALWPHFERIGQLGAGRDQRFLDRGIAVVGLPDEALPTLCEAVGAAAEKRVADALCGARAGSSARPPTTVPGPLTQAIARAIGAFERPLRVAEERALALRAQAESGGAELREHADAIAAIESDIAPFRQRFQIASGDDGGPQPLRCAARWLDAAFAARPRGDAEALARATTARANGVLLLAAALDGRAATTPLAAEALLPASLGTATCRGGSESLAATAALMADARQSLANARKNEAMRSLVSVAGLQWAAAMALGYAFVAWSRRSPPLALGIAAALAAWGSAAWLGRVAWPLGVTREIAFGRADDAWTSAPAAFVIGLFVAASAFALIAVARRAPARPAPVAQSMSSRIGYPGFVLVTGLGALILLDLSLAGHAGNRYLALYHQGHLWLAMLTLSLLVFARRSVSRGLAALLSVGGEAVRRASGRFGAASIAFLLLAATAVAVLAFGLALAHLRQLTSELGRVWLIVGAAWFFFLRAGPLTERLARSGTAAASFLRYAWPMLFVVVVLVAAMFVTRDMGPLLIAAYAAGAFLAAALAMWWHHRSGQVFSAFALALVLFAGWIGAVTFALFHVGAHDSVTASRLESVVAPFASINDQLALVSWFQRAAPSEGFGIGLSPWCGFAASRGCSGVPAQIHSDYTFTAMVGLFGPFVSWALSLAIAIWLHRLIRHHGRITRGEPRLIGSGDQLGHDGQALLSWMAVAWVVLTSCQLAVTVAGNLAVLPLTGVTFPFVSFGMTSLLVNTAFLALCLNVDVPGRGAHG
ncbi:MAG: FtsW/RodA/SpoVE family cell cycle protein, partial [Caldimonas sp.]